MKFSFTAFVLLLAISQITKVAAEDPKLPEDSNQQDPSLSYSPNQLTVNFLTQSYPLGGAPQGQGYYQPPASVAGLYGQPDAYPSQQQLLAPPQLGMVPQPVQDTRPLPQSGQPNPAMLAQNGQQQQQAISYIAVAPPRPHLIYNFSHFPSEISNPFNLYSLPRVMNNYNGLMAPFNLINPTNYIYGDSPYQFAGYYPQLPNFYADPFTTGINGGYNYGMNPMFSYNQPNPMLYTPGMMQNLIGNPKAMGVRTYNNDLSLTANHQPIAQQPQDAQVYNAGVPMAESNADNSGQNGDQQKTQNINMLI